MKNHKKKINERIILMNDHKETYLSPLKCSTPRSSSHMKIYSYADTISGCKNLFAYHLQHAEKNHHVNSPQKFILKKKNSKSIVLKKKYKKLVWCEKTNVLEAP